MIIPFVFFCQGKMVHFSYADWQDFQEGHRATGPYLSFVNLMDSADLPLENHREISSMNPPSSFLPFSK
ncbi:MAG: hypothetical protein A2512_12180 [Deltaproteobacteria bacterium RIFOXYD12_FULL_56_24]|nr:MAG: hypothetical protein A2512_12180 [Deltaproteobacteria bacterium RIFOXYD12_FULL_56_24]